MLSVSDNSFLTNCRAMLEPILEEPSEEEETNQELWSQYESIWSSESDTGSVIRVDLTQGKILLIYIIKLRSDQET